MRRANDLIWNYVVNNWFQGKHRPRSTSRLEHDSTRMPVAMHSQYLRACYLMGDLSSRARSPSPTRRSTSGDHQSALRAGCGERPHRARGARRISRPSSSAATTSFHADELRAYRRHRGRRAGEVRHWTLDDPGHASADESFGGRRHDGSWWEDWADWADARGPMGEPAELPPAVSRAGAYVRNETRTALRSVRRRQDARPYKRAPRSGNRMNDNWKSLGEFIKAQRELANLSLRQLADMADISNPYLGQIERGMYKPSADVLKNIASALRSRPKRCTRKPDCWTRSRRTAAGFKRSKTRSSWIRRDHGSERNADPHLPRFHRAALTARSTMSCQGMSFGITLWALRMRE